MDMPDPRAQPHFMVEHLRRSSRVWGFVIVLGAIWFGWALNEYVDANEEEVVLGIGAVTEPCVRQ